MQIFTKYAERIDEWIDRRSPSPSWDTGRDLMPDLPPGRPLKMRDIRKFQALELKDLNVNQLYCYHCDTWHWPNRRCFCHVEHIMYSIAYFGLSTLYR